MIQKNQLFQGERVIARSDGDTLVLTNKRVRYSEIRNHQLYVVSILLQNVQSIDIRYRSKLAFLVVSLVLFYFTLLGSGSQLMNIFNFILAAGLLIYYFTTIQHVCAIHAGKGESITFKADLMKEEELLAFVNTVEEAIVTK